MVDRTVIRMAKLAKGENLCQFCPRCRRLIMRNGGCNHILCVCGHDFCVICAGDWVKPPEDPGLPAAPLCHPFYGAEDQHVLRIPPEIEARLAEEENKPATAYADENATGVLCHHSADLLYTLRLRRELDDEERSRARCDVCGRTFRAFLLQCVGCRTLLCLGCRDLLWAERSENRPESSSDPVKLEEN